MYDINNGQYRYALVKDANDMDWDSCQFRSLISAIRAYQAFRIDYPDAQIVILDVLQSNEPTCVKILTEVNY